MSTIRLKQIIVFFSSIILLTKQPHCFAQKPDKQDGKTRKGQKEASNNKPKKFDYPPLENGNIVPGSPTSSSIIFNIILENEGEAFIEYGTLSDSYSHKTSKVTCKNAAPVEICINNLSAGKSYFYRLNYRAAGDIKFKTSAESWFTTQRKKSETFSFGVQGDSHPERNGKMFNPDLYKLTVDNVAVKKPDFYFMMGDDFSIDKLIQNNTATKNNIEKIYEQQRYYWGNAGKNPPLFLINGNHEQAAKYLLDGTSGSPAVLAANTRNKYFPLPSPGGFYSGDNNTIQHIGLLKDYYSFEWGDALFVVIDPYWHSDEAVDNEVGAQGKEKKSKKEPWGITLGETQYKWFKQILETSKARFKFVFCHHISGTGRGGVERAKLFEWGGYGQNGQWQFDKFRPGWEIPIHQLMVKNRVTIFFQGHDHIFAKQELDGVIYQSVPNPADDTYTAFNRDAYTSGVIMPNSGFLNVTVGAKEVKLEYVRSYLKDNPLLNEGAKSGFTYTVK